MEALDLNILIYVPPHTLTSTTKHCVRVCNPLGYTFEKQNCYGRSYNMHVYALELALVSAHKSPSSFCRFRVTRCYNFTSFN